MTAADSRLDVWRSLGASVECASELAAYTDGGPVNPRRPDTCPLPDEPFATAWRQYVNDATVDGVETVLRRVFVQLHFPIGTGVSETESYRAATRRGVLVCDESATRFTRPDCLKIFLHPTPAGRIPVIVSDTRDDFELLVRALTCRNEPERLPPAMGACVVAGYVNWERVGALGSTFTLADLAERKDLYQDRFIILSNGPYSNTPASALGLDAAAWASASLTLRLHHEATHYFTRRAFGSMRNNLLDELVADYIGLVAATGRYDADVFLRFMGLENHRQYRPGGRLENYRGRPPLGDRAFTVLQRGVVLAARAIEEFHGVHPLDMDDLVAVADRITTLTRVGLDGLVSPLAARRLSLALAA